MMIVSGYSELLQESSKATMTAQRLRSLYTEIYKKLNQLNPGFTSSIFKLSSSKTAARKEQFVNLGIIRSNQVNFGKKS